MKAILLIAFFNCIAFNGYTQDYNYRLKLSNTVTTLMNSLRSCDTVNILSMFDTLHNSRGSSPQTVTMHREEIKINCKLFNDIFTKFGIQMPDPSKYKFYYSNREMLDIITVPLYTKTAADSSIEYDLSVYFYFNSPGKFEYFFVDAGSAKVATVKKND